MLKVVLFSYICVWNCFIQFIEQNKFNNKYIVLTNNKE